MSRIFVSGLVNVETCCKVEKFPVEYTPVDYNFFGVTTNVSGVGYNLAKAFSVLGDEVSIAAMVGNDLAGDMAKIQLSNLKIDLSNVKTCLNETPVSTVIFDNEGRRKIFCDLKDIQDRKFEFEKTMPAWYDVAAVCNINYNRALLEMAKEMGITIATDVHVLWNIYDEYNQDFMKYADILFLSDEGIEKEPKKFISDIENTYHNKIIVLGQGSDGALMLVRDENKFYDLPAVYVENVVNTVGAGDALFAAFVSMYAEGKSPLDCLKYAQLFAAEKIKASGASNGFVSKKRLEELWDRSHADIMQN